MIDAIDRVTTNSKPYSTLIDKIVGHINSNTIEQETITLKHPILGEMTKVDWIHFMIAHTNRHLVQIEEVKTVAKIN